MAVTAIHPGEHLAEELEALGMSASELARKLAVPANRVTAILNGQRGLTGDTALRLATFWHERRVLAQSAEPLRIAHCREEGWKVDKGASEVEAARRRRGLKRVGGYRFPTKR